jgi:small-conductance mechanosensitive channel
MMKNKMLIFWSVLFAANFFTLFVGLQLKSFSTCLIGGSMLIYSLVGIYISLPPPDKE